MSTGNGLVHLKIDGKEVAVPPTKIAYDPLYKKNVEIPTTIYDAAQTLAQQAGGKNPIPILCHREHVNPVAVCRVCVVEVNKQWRLTPACHRQVENGMEINTAETSPRVKHSIQILTELLLADQPPSPTQQGSNPNELFQVADRYGVRSSRFPKSKTDRGHDDTSVVIAVDQNACILCDRCIRGCNEIRNNQVLGRAGKGYTAHIAFDLDTPMGNSTCVACGECMISCPTSALTFRNPVQATPWKDVAPKPEAVSADTLAKYPLFEGVSEKFLRFNEGAVVRRHFKKGDLICREGEFGSTAFLIEKGTVNIFIESPIKHVKSRKNNRKGDSVNRGVFGLVRRFSSGLVGRNEDKREEESTTRYIHIDAPVSLDYANPIAQLTAGDIFGEMTCMNNYPRSATVQAAEDCTVLEMLRNVLYILQRNNKSKALLEKRYRERAVSSHLRSVPIFASLVRDERAFGEFVDYLRDRVELIRLYPGEVIFRQGDSAEDFYLVRIGFVKVSQNHLGGEHVLTYKGPGDYFGEIGLMSDIPEIRALAAPGVRTATCSALDHVDLVRVKSGDFLQLLNKFPQVREHLVKIAIQNLKENEEAHQQVQSLALGDFLKQGLMNAQSLLVLDLEKCTRCDECTKACADAHDGVTRLIREGLRFDKYLVASSCRSCLDPYCMVGCPVGSIRRRNSREIIIEDWCIGCGKCAENCPYGNINMHPFEDYRPDPANPGRKVAVVQQKATSCDLCSELDGQPSCVYACPHDAAHRMTGRDLLQTVERSQ
jgi:CRP-like cAMP-binding protein/Fe-S-cluster-containing dehydrogenase component